MSYLLEPGHYIFVAVVLLCLYLARRLDLAEDTIKAMGKVITSMTKELQRRGSKNVANFED